MRYNPLPLLVCCWLALAGCGAGQGDITGVVKYKGKPLQGGTLSFFVANKVESATIDSNGSYRVIKVPTGVAKLAVTTPFDIRMPGLPPGPKFTAIPDKYADRETSGLTYEVLSGPQTHNLDLD